MINSFFAAVIIALASFAGALFTSTRSKTWLSKNMNYLLAFSGGIFLITAINLANEAFEFLGASMGALSILGGFLFLWVVQVLIPETHKHEDTSSLKGLSKSGKKVLVGDAIHNIGDGILLVPAFALSPALGLAVAISILVHEFIQEISEFFVLRASGYSTRKALALNFLSASTIVVGVLIGMVLVNTEGLQGLLLGISAGVFLQIVVHDLLPFARVRGKDISRAWPNLALFLSGILVMTAVGAVAPHTHEHGDEDHDHEHVEEVEHYAEHDDEHEDEHEHE